jgi:transketolase
VTEAWRVALRHRTGPSAIVLTRQKLPFFSETERIRAHAARGAYVLKDSDGRTPSVVLMASGSEVAIALEAQALLEAQRVPTRVVSVLSQELFTKQSASYQESVLPAGVPRVAVEAAHPMSWYRFVGLRGAVVGLETFGASAPYQTLYRELGLTADNVAAAAMRVLGA